MRKLEPYILYAEDEDTDAILFERAFRKAGIDHRLVRVADGRAAIDYLTRATAQTEITPYGLPSAALLDIHMPDMSGLEVLQWVRNNAALRSLVTIVLSSSEHPLDFRRAYALGANGYLVKPATLEECLAMARTLKDWLAQYAEGTHLAPTFPVSFSEAELASDPRTTL
ncbi:MAG: response regulator [Limisphaerales bacterium]